MSRFVAETYQNEFLPVGGTQVDAIVTVTAVDGAPLGEPPQAAEVLIVDASGSMGWPSRKLKAAKQATAAAIDTIRDGTLFGVVAGTHTARTVHPRSGGLVPASPATRAEARAAVDALRANGGTAIGSWLALADRLFEESAATLRHAILLTDGQNQNESAEELDRVLAACEGHFQCDCRGVGTDWEVGELRRVASALLGSVDIIAEPSQMAADFRALAERAMGRGTANVALRLWHPQGAAVRFVRQVAPAIEDLTARATPVDALTSDYPTGAWGDESRDYHLCIDVAARDVGDEATATFKLGRAVKLAAEGGNDATMRLLQRVVEVDDAATGKIRLRRDVDDVDEMSLDTRSTKTVRVQRTVP